jgi:sec-independent protein translocase protein TatB
MIDLGLTKIAVIGVVALVVIGPEKLPKVARMAGSLYGRMQRYLHEVKSEVSREIELEELRNLKKEVEETAHTIRSDVETSLKDSMDDVESAWRDLPTSTAPAATMSDLERKARDFRRKKLVKTSSVPAWYKNRNGARQHVLSGAARVRKFRPGIKSNTSFF